MAVEDGRGEQRPDPAAQVMHNSVTLTLREHEAEHRSFNRRLGFDRLHPGHQRPSAIASTAGSTASSCDLQLRAAVLATIGPNSPVGGLRPHWLPAPTEQRVRRGTCLCGCILSSLCGPLLCPRCGPFRGVWHRELFGWALALWYLRRGRSRLLPDWSSVWHLVQLATGCRSRSVLSSVPA